MKISICFLTLMAAALWILEVRAQNTDEHAVRIISNNHSKPGSMKDNTFTVISVAGNIHVGDGQIVSSESFPASDSLPWRVSKRTLRGGVQEGVELIEIDNGKTRFSVIPTRGMSVYEVRCGDVRLGWDSPVKQIVHPQHVDLQDHGGLGWLVGFNEWMVRCGVAFAGHPGEDDGRLLTLHGRIGNIPASEVQIIIDPQPPHRIRVRGRVEEKMFKFGVFELWTEISTVPGGTALQFEDRLINRSEYEQEYQIIYHANYGPPILDKGATFVGAVDELWPFDEYAAQDITTYQTYLGPTPKYGEQVYCMRLHADENGMTTAMLHNAAADKGVAMKYAVDTLPGFTLWKNTDTAADGYVTGLEPGTGFPYNRAVERAHGRVPKLAAGGEVSFRVEVAVLDDAESVAETRATIDRLGGGKPPTTHQAPPISDQ